MLNLAHWRLMVAVADLGSISRAAERVGITQSGASQAIAQLEAALGLQVFARTRQELHITALGEPVLVHARAMLAQLEAIRALADASRGLSQGRIRLGSFPSVISTFLPDLLSRFRQRHPGIDIVAIEGSDVEVLDWLAQDAIDIGVVLNPAEPALILGRDAWMALLPVAHPLARKREVALRMLQDEPFILATGGCAVNGLSLMHDARLALNDIRVTVRDWASACALVREGMGIALVPQSTLPEDMRNLRALPLAPKVHRQFGLQCSRAGEASPAVTAFCAHVRAEHRKR